MYLTTPVKTFPHHCDIELVYTCFSGVDIAHFKIKKVDQLKERRYLDFGKRGAKGKKKKWFHRSLRGATLQERF